MNYRHFGNTFSKNTELLIKGCIYINCMDYDEYSREIDEDLMNDYILEGYRIYMKDDSVDPFTIGNAIWQVYYEYQEWDGNPENDNIDIFDVEGNLSVAIDLARSF